MFGLKNRILSFLERMVKRYGRRIPVRVPVLKNELLKGRRALVTGGSRGIGLAIAQAFLRAGCEVIITGRDVESLKSAVEILAPIGPRVGFIVLDNRYPESFGTKIEEIIKEFGMVDILVNNAGFTKGGYFGASTISAYDEVFDSVLRGAWFLSQEFAERWKSGKVRANILNICSTSSLRPGVCPYVLCKWGERSMTIGLAKMLLPYDIVVNGIGPGVTDVERKCATPESDISFPMNPSGRFVTRDELANMAVILTSDLGRMVVGDIVYMGGGAGIITYEDA